MQKVSLAITVVSLGLFSNVALSHRSVEKEAEAELDQLLKIRKKIATDTVGSIIKDALFRQQVIAGDYQMGSKLWIENDPDLSWHVSFPFPKVFCERIPFDLEMKAFGENRYVEGYTAGLEYRDFGDELLEIGRAYKYETANPPGSFCQDGMGAFRRPRV
jgi:hypothetical protein